MTRKCLFLFIKIIKKNAGILEKWYTYNCLKNIGTELQNVKKWLWVVFIILIIISTVIGVRDLSFKDIITLQDEAWQIIRVSRIPRTLSIIFAGFGMSLAGLIMQQLSRNKFVSPSTAATLDSAKFGVLLSMIFFSGAGIFFRLGFSFIIAMIGTFIFMQIIGKIKGKNMLLIPLIGIILGNVINAITTFLAYRMDVIQTLNAYMIGDFSLVIQGRYEMLYLIVPLVVLTFGFAYKFSIASMGEDFSKNLGLNYKQVVWIGLILVSMITASILVTIGSIPFLGLIVPNIVVLYNGDLLQKNILQTALFGSVILLVADIVGRVIIYPYEIPIGLTIGVLGSLVFMILLIRKTIYGK